MVSTIHWTGTSTAGSAYWRSESATPPPSRVVGADDRVKADAAYRLACEGTALLWQGDFHNARQPLQATGRRIDRKPAQRGDSPADSFHLQRRARGHRARVLGRLLVLLADDDYCLNLRRRELADPHRTPH